MNLFQPISIAAACVLALSACVSAPPAQRTRAPVTLAKAPPPAAGGGGALTRVAGARVGCAGGAEAQAESARTQAAAINIG